MGKMISVTEYAALKGINPDNVRQKILRGNLPAQKNGRNWLIDENTPYTDARRRLSSQKINQLGEAYSALAWAMHTLKPGANTTMLETPGALGYASTHPVLALTKGLRALEENRGTGPRPNYVDYIDEVMMEALDGVDLEDVSERLTVEESSAWWIGYYHGRHKGYAGGEAKAQTAPGNPVDKT